MTLLEILVAVAIVAILGGIAIPAYSNYVYMAKVDTAIADIRGLEVKINAYYADYLRFPQNLGDVNKANLLDPWGTPYQYILIADMPTTGPGKVECRKDKDLHPINSDYDLYSKGRDRKTVLALTANSSQDDVIRAEDGRYIGLVEKNTKLK